MIYVAAGRNGVLLKKKVVEHLRERGYRVQDLGTDDEAVMEYPMLAFDVGEKVSADPTARGILFSGRGTGMCIAANKVKGVNAAAVSTEAMAEKTRLEDNSNVLCLPSHIVSAELAISMVTIWMNTSFSGSEYNVRCLRKIREYEHES